MVKNCRENSANFKVESDIENNEPNVFTAKFVGKKLGNYFQDKEMPF